MYSIKTIDGLKEAISKNSFELYEYLSYLEKNELFDEESFVFGQLEHHNFFEFLTNLEDPNSHILLAYAVNFFKDLEYDISNVIKKQVLPFIINKENFNDYYYAFKYRSIDLDLYKSKNMQKLNNINILF